MQEKLPVFNDWLFNVSDHYHILYARVAGSRAYGLANESSDIDISAVYQASNRDILGLFGYSESIEAKNPDVIMHELGKFCTLLLKGNPTIVESLCDNTNEFVGYRMAQLRKERERFILNRTVLKQYIGYCEGQLSRLMNGKSLHTTGNQYNGKWASHIVRLGINAMEIANGILPTIDFTGHFNHVILKEIKSDTGAKYGKQWVIDWWATGKAILEMCLPNMPPLEEKDRKVLNEWLLATRGL